MSHTISIRHDLKSGDLGRIIALHGENYERLPGFGLRFEAYVARTVAEFVLENSAKGRIWLAERDGKLVGCTAIARRDKQQAQLRWVLVDPLARGVGLGRQLVENALAYCRESGCTTVYLETTDGLPESQSLYESLGFAVTSSQQEVLWDGPRELIRMNLSLE